MRSLVMLMGVLGLLACNGPGVRVPPPIVDSWTASLPVMVNAGADRQVLAGALSCLDGRSSYHPLGQTYYLTWTQTAGEPVHLSDVASRTPCFVAPLGEQTLAFRLTANDGTWITMDNVQMEARQLPTALAPRLRAGPDRFVKNGEPQVPADDDVLEANPNVLLAWEPLAVEPAPGARDGAILASASIFRLSGHTRDGLDALPDYLLLWPYDASLISRYGPRATLVGPSVANTGAQVILDAADSADDFGDALRWRWAQTCGDSTLPDPGNAQQAVVRLAGRPQVQCFRVTVRDSLLESAPADLVVKVQAPPGRPVPEVAPPSLAVHAGNAVVLSADPNAANPNTVLYTWTQTVGGRLDIVSTPADGPRLSFMAPAALGFLALSVQASDGAVTSGDAVAVIEVVDAARNTAPVVTLCAETLEPAAGSPVALYASALDPEQDALSPSLTWGTAPPGSVSITSEPVGNRPPGCPLPASRTGAPVQALEGRFTAPASGTSFTVTVTVCDTLNACGAASLAFAVP